MEPVLEKQFREVTFDGRLISVGGGIDQNDDTITFLANHNFRNGQAIIYDNLQNQPIGIGTFKGSNYNQNQYLQTGTLYFSQIVNNRTIKLFGNFTDYSNGINTVGFTTINTQGIHKFRVYDGKTTLRSIKVINPGKNYENRLLTLLTIASLKTTLLVSLSNISIVSPIFKEDLSILDNSVNDEPSINKVFEYDENVII